MKSRYIPTVPYTLLNVFRSVGIDFASHLANWCGERLIAPYDEENIHCRIGRIVERFTDWLFGFCYPGSREEILSVINEEVPVEYMSERQLEVYRRISEWGFTNIDEVES